MRLVGLVCLVALGCGRAGLNEGSDGGSSGGGVAGGAVAGGTSAAGGGSSAGGSSAGGSSGGGSAGGTPLPLCVLARPTTSCDDEGGPLNGQSNAKGRCGAGQRCTCTAPFELNPITGRCRAVVIQAVCLQHDAGGCHAIASDGGAVADGTCGSLPLPAGCGCELDFSVNHYRVRCDRTCLPPGDGGLDCQTLNCGSVACLDNTRCLGPSSCR